MDLFEKYKLALPYDEFLNQYGTEGQRRGWQDVHDRIALNPEWTELLQSFRRTMPVLCLAGAWCGDCISQCPIFQRFAETSAAIQLRFLDRDDHPDVQSVLQINAGNRVPVVVFFSEDGHEVGRYGERTLSQYRQLAGRTSNGADLAASVTQDWLNEFERVQWLLRLSPRLRQRHGD